MDPMFGVHLAPFLWRPPHVQMEYLQKKEYFPFKTVLIYESLQITLEKKLPSVLYVKTD